MKSDSDQHDARSAASRAACWLSLIAVVVATSIGCTSLAVRTKTPVENIKVTDELAHPALSALERLFRTYESGDSITDEPFLDPSMIGVQPLLRNIRETQAQQSQIHIFLKNIQTTINPNIVIISATWEKRYLTQPSLMQKMISGNASFVMIPTQTGWKLTGIKGDNLFAAK